MLRRIVTALTVCLLASGLAGASTASASATATARCDAMLIDLADKQSVLEELQSAVTKGQADRDALAEKTSRLAMQIAETKAAGNDTRALERRHTTLLTELADLSELAPVVKSQADALAADVDQIERAYIGCIDATISG